LLVVTVLNLAHSGLTTVGYVVIAVLAAVLVLRTKLHPFLILLSGGMLGWFLGLPPVAAFNPAMPLP
jgi:hypothetical protein